MRFISIFLSFILFSCQLFAGTAFNEQEAQSKINNFYAAKSRDALKNITTYQDRYMSLAILAYPRTFWGDTIPGFAPYDKEGELFKAVLQISYEDIKDNGFINSGALARDIAAEIILNPRRIDVAQKISLPSPGDIGYTSFYLASYYGQLGDFINKISSEEKAYSQYKKYLSEGNNFMARGYENYDFSLGKGLYDKNVFYKRRREIETFIKEYTLTANNFIKKVLAPMQTDHINGADVKKYLDDNLNTEALPRGVDAVALKKVILSEIPAPEAFYKEAERVNPSFSGQMSSFGTIFLNTLNAKKSDFLNVLSLLEYISPGVLVRRLERYGKIPSHEVVTDDIASAMAAGALNKSVAQIANDLFEFEKPFYYSYFSFGGAENDIVENWRSIALNNFYGDKKIAAIAADNIMKSGRRRGQDFALSSQLINRRINRNLAFYEKSIPIMLDFAAGDAVFVLASPLVKSSRLVMASREAALTKSLKTASTERTAFKTIVSAKAKNAISSSSSARHMKFSDGIMRPVWELRNSAGEVTSYVKYGSKRELLRNHQLDKIMREKNLGAKYNLLEIEYPKVLSEGLDKLPSSVARDIKVDFNYMVSRDPNLRARREMPFISSKVDVSGFTMTSSSRESAALLNGRPISNKEWGQIVDFYKDLNSSGFYHTDIWNNLHIRRLPDGKLKITILDFEHFGRSDMKELALFEEALIRFGLKKRKSWINYSGKFGYDAAQADMKAWPQAGI